MHYYSYKSTYFVSESERVSWADHQVDGIHETSGSVVYVYSDTKPFRYPVFSKLQEHHFMQRSMDAFAIVYRRTPIELTKEQEQLLSLSSSALNTAEIEGAEDLQNVHRFVMEHYEFNLGKKQINILGLGDVGSIMSIGIKLLGGNVVHTMGVYDVNESQRKRWEIELSQISINESIKVKAIEANELFQCDVFVFCASVGVPPVGSEVSDVRMAQYNGNKQLIKEYVQMAINQNFKGLFLIVSDPVDLLCRVAYEYSNGALRPEQIKGYGLGVMDARANYHAENLNINYRGKGRVFGPHGMGLVVANDIEYYDDAVSKVLTERVVSSNLAVRALGYKPYIAPALSSGAKAIVATLEGHWHYSTTFLEDVYWGALNCLGPLGQEYSYEALPDQLYERIHEAHLELGEQWIKLK